MKYYFIFLLLFMNVDCEAKAIELNSEQVAWVLNHIEKASGNILAVAASPKTIHIRYQNGSIVEVENVTHSSFTAVQSFGEWEIVANAHQNVMSGYLLEQIQAAFDHVVVESYTIKNR